MSTTNNNDNNDNDNNKTPSNDLDKLTSKNSINNDYNKNFNDVNDVNNANCEKETNENENDKETSNSDSDDENEQETKSDSLNFADPMGMFLSQLIAEAFKIQPGTNSDMFVPTGFDCKIERYGKDGSVKSEQIFSVGTKNDTSTKTDTNDLNKTDDFDQMKNIHTNTNININQKNLNVKNIIDDVDKVVGKDVNPNINQNDDPDINIIDKRNDTINLNSDLSNGKKKTDKKKSNSNSNPNDNLKKKIIIHKVINNDTNSKSKIDYASSIGDEKYLNEWLKLNLDSENKFNGSLEDYTTESIDHASANGKINILKWWKKAHDENCVELKYTEKAINFASKNNHLSSLNWWKDESGLELKYNHNAVDFASSKFNSRILDWWVSNALKTKSGLKFDYTSNSIDNAKLSEDHLMSLVKWWKSTIEVYPTIKFKYTRDFIDYLEAWNYEKVYDFLQQNKMISQSDKYDSSKSKNESEQNNGPSNFFEFFGIPIKVGSGNNVGMGMKKKSSSGSKFDISTLPEDIQKHIAEKEEELNNNMMINGKAKEYIDNLVKIPFGKYKIEKIFSFVEDLIKKINQINIESSNNFISAYKITNESDLVGFFTKVQLFPSDTYTKYSCLYDKFIQIRKKYMEYVNGILDETVYGHNATKKHIKCIISQWLSGGFKTGVVIGIQGPPGVGKTTMIKGALSKCLIDFIMYDLDCEVPFITQIDMNDVSNQQTPRPFCFMSLGGTTNGSTLSGHNITYHGATSGDIVKHLKEAGIMNPILYFDELDKISNTEYGHEISSVLTHITDPVQNSHFTDRYFAEVKIDLSKCVIVFSYNDTNKIDRILLDRIQEIRLNPIKPNEKLVICKKFIIPEICSQLGCNPEDFIIDDLQLSLIINEYTMEAGVRKLKEKLFEVFRMNHLELIETESENDKSTISTISNKKTLSEKFINDVFSDYPKITHKKIFSSNMIGCINGLYASALGIGGITPIQVKQIYLKENLGISITGSVEKVMEESVKVAKTVAWNLLLKDQQDEVIKNWDSRGIHIHFPDGSTSKDGPSGGTAITCAIYSLFTSKPIKNNIAITGEIDLDGNVTQIGGLDAKLNGAKKAGIKIALVPKENHRELEIVRKNNPGLIGKDFKVFKILHVKDALKYIF